jgi:hypothetical protein
MVAAMRERFTVRPDPSGYRVHDAWTGETVVIGTMPQTGLSAEDAEHTAAMLNQRANEGDLSVLH